MRASGTKREVKFRRIDANSSRGGFPSHQLSHFATMSASIPPSYKDFGKAANDLISKDFAIGSELARRSRSFPPR